MIGRGSPEDSEQLYLLICRACEPASRAFRWRQQDRPGAQVSHFRQLTERRCGHESLGTPDDPDRPLPIAAVAKVLLKGDLVRPLDG